MDDTEENTKSPRKKAVFYVDGFNFYHALKELKKPHLKWFNWRQFAETLCKKYNLQLVKIVFCTAKPEQGQKDIEVIKRHKEYMKALENSGVTVLKGFFISETVECYHCKEPWNRYTEKQGDVNLAVSLTTDGLLDIFDIAFLVTSDSDQVPAITSVVQNTTHQVVTLYADWRNATTKASKKLANECNKSKTKILKEKTLAITKDDIQNNLFGALVKNPERNDQHVRRPRKYDPPKVN